MHIALIPSGNGLGHLRRAILLSNFLIKFSKVTLFAKKKKIFLFKLNNKIKIKNLLIKSIFSKSDIYKNSWVKKFKNRDNKYNFYFLDNFPDLIRYKKNLIIFANFFWHRELNLRNKQFIEYEKKIYNNKIITMGNYLFQKKYMDKFNNFKIPFFGSYKKSLKKTSILISFGTAYYKDIKRIKKKLDLMIKKHKFSNVPIYLDPKLYNKSYKKYKIYKANYSRKMYDSVRVALIKPGLGTTEECLQRGIPVLSYVKNTFGEFKFNSNILVLNKLGYKFNNFESAINFSMKIFKDKSKIKFFEKNCKNLKWHGEKIVKRNLFLNIKDLK